MFINPLIHGRGADLPPIAIEGENSESFKVSKNKKKLGIGLLGNKLSLPLKVFLLKMPGFSAICK